jgi:hypothetical protein
MGMGKEKYRRLPITEDGPDGLDIDVSCAAYTRIKYHWFWCIQKKDGTFCRPQVIQIISYKTVCINDDIGTSLLFLDFHITSPRPWTVKFSLAVLS